MTVANTDLEAGYYVYIICISAPQNDTGLPKPSWLRNGDMARLTELAAFTLTIMFNSKEKTRLTAGKQRVSVICLDVSMSMAKK